jgi:nucleoside-diphosphate-sugar epimerase
VRVFILGGTGVIGSAVVRELIARGHDVYGLARSQASAAKLDQCGAKPIFGDLASPERWVANLPHIGALVHAACDFNTDMGAIDRHLLDLLLPALAAQPNKVRFITTGGCWLYGVTGDVVATEETAFRPLPAFAWMVPQLRRVLASSDVDGIVIHPAMVYAAEGGVFRRFAREAVEREAIRVVADEAVRWPLVHSEDLATLYALALERAPARSSYIGAAFRRGHRSRARRMGQGLCAWSAVERSESATRARLAAETSRSGSRDRGACLRQWPKKSPLRGGLIYTVLTTTYMPFGIAKSRCLHRLLNVLLDAILPESWGGMVRRAGLAARILTNPFFKDETCLNAKNSTWMPLFPRRYSLPVARSRA